MERDYRAEYITTLKKTLRGAKVRQFFLGYKSSILDEYLENQHSKLWGIKEDAPENDDFALEKKVLDLSRKLFDFEVDRDYKRLNLARL